MKDMPVSDLLAALSHLCGVGVVAVYRERPKHAWPPMPRGTYTQHWLLTFESSGVWVESSAVFRDPKRCQALLERHGRQANQPAITAQQARQILALMHAIAGDTPTPNRPHQRRQ